MKIVRSADWRENLPFETPMIVADVAPGDDAKCAACPADAPMLPRTELWAIKHRHPNNHSGFVRFYCADHLPAAPAAPEPTTRAAKPKRAKAAKVAPPKVERMAQRRSPSVEETPKAVCPNCFIEIPSTGVCGICGEAVR